MRMLKRVMLVVDMILWISTLSTNIMVWDNGLIQKGRDDIEVNADLKNGNIISGIGLINRHSHPQFNNKIYLMIWVEVLKMVTSVVVIFLWIVTPYLDQKTRILNVLQIKGWKCYELIWNERYWITVWCLYLCYVTWIHISSIYQYGMQ